ncbi:Uncharacterised protein [Cedecea neteri]|uniref:Uncharacterized protein n=1 Tax=Cedecea neteri TaxID=158822 RepID=A0A2X3IKI4_9ENTR|nr:Uncharacterised protein [Cedecea neteri]
MLKITVTLTHTSASGVRTDQNNSCGKRKDSAPEQNAVRQTHLARKRTRKSWAISTVQALDTRISVISFTAASASSVSK